MYYEAAAPPASSSSPYEPYEAAGANGSVKGYICLDGASAATLDHPTQQHCLLITLPARRLSFLTPGVRCWRHADAALAGAAVGRRPDEPGSRHRRVGQGRRAQRAREQPAARAADDVPRRRRALRHRTRWQRARERTISVAPPSSAPFSGHAAATAFSGGWTVRSRSSWLDAEARSGSSSHNADSRSARAIISSAWRARRTSSGRRKCERARECSIRGGPRHAVASNENGGRDARSATRQRGRRAHVARGRVRRRRRRSWCALCDRAAACRTALYVARRRRERPTRGVQITSPRSCAVACAAVAGVHDDHMHCERLGCHDRQLLYALAARCRSSRCQRQGPAPARWLQRAGRRPSCTPACLQLSLDLSTGAMPPRRSSPSPRRLGGLHAHRHGCTLLRRRRVRSARRASSAGVGIAKAIAGARATALHHDKGARLRQAGIGRSTCAADSRRRPRQTCASSTRPTSTAARPLRADGRLRIADCPVIQ